jgi:hypothetical protein
MVKMNRVVAFAVVCCGMVGACGDDNAGRQLPYPTDKTTLIGDYDNPKDLAGYRTVTTPDGDACINLDDVCVKPQAECGEDAVADVLLDDQGNVVDTICYPTGGVAVETVEGDLKKLGNDVVLVLDDKDDGVDIDGDVTIDGNNVTLYGHGPDTSVIGGDLHIDKNNSLVRGVRVEGDVVIDKNNPSITNCVIEGDLTILGNNVSIALCEVWGKLTIEGNNAILVGNHFASPPAVKGKNTVCNGNFEFADADADGKIADSEVGAAIDCSAKEVSK